MIGRKTCPKCGSKKYKKLGPDLYGCGKCHFVNKLVV